MANRLGLTMSDPFDQAWRILKVLPMAAMAPTGATGKTVGALAMPMLPNMQVVPRKDIDVRRRGAAQTYPPGLTPPTPELQPRPQQMQAEQDARGQPYGSGYQQ